MTVTDATTEVLRRIRDAGESGTTSAQVRFLLDEACRLFSQRQVRGSFELPLVKGQHIYPLNDRIDDHRMIVKVRLNGEVLDHIPWTTLNEGRPGWLSEIGQPRYWSQYGWCVLVIGPGPIEDGQVVTVHTQVAQVASDELFDRLGDRLELVLTTAAALALLRARNFDAAQAAFPFQLEAA